MSDLDDSKRNRRPPDSARRALLSAIVAACATSFFPSSLAVAATETARSRFLAISKLLTGRPTLDPDQADRIYAALSHDDLQFPTNVEALLALVEQRKIEPLQLQQFLDVEEPGLVTVPRRILRAWYVGVVGADDHARCIAFETNLMNVIVSDHLTPPSYCYGVYGSWAQKPV